MKRNQLFNARNLTMMAALIAMQIILARYLSIQSEVFRISLETIPLALAGLWMGPLAAVIVAFVSDVIGFMIAGIGVYFPPLTLGPVVFALVCGLGSRYWLGDSIADVKSSWKVCTITVLAGIINSFLIGTLAFTLYQMWVMGVEGAFTELVVVNFLSRLATKPLTIVATAILVTALNQAVYRSVICRIVRHV